MPPKHPLIVYNSVCSSALNVSKETTQTTQTRTICTAGSSDERPHGAPLCDPNHSVLKGVGWTHGHIRRVHVLPVWVCPYVDMHAHFLKLHGAFSGITLAGNTCFQLTGQGGANRAQQLHKGNKKERRLLWRCQWGSFWGQKCRSLAVFYSSKS